MTHVMYFIWLTDDLGVWDMMLDDLRTVNAIKPPGWDVDKICTACCDITKDSTPIKQTQFFKECYESRQVFFLQKYVRC